MGGLVSLRLPPRRSVSYGGLPLALGTGAGSEVRTPLGVAIVGGLLVSQILTLYTTPVIYLYMDRLAHHVSRRIAPAANSRQNV